MYPTLEKVKEIAASGVICGSIYTRRSDAGFAESK